MKYFTLLLAVAAIICSPLFISSAQAKTARLHKVKVVKKHHHAAQHARHHHKHA